MVRRRTVLLGAMLIFLCAPSSAHTQTVSDLLKQLHELQVRFAQLQALSVQGASSCTLTRTLSFGSRGADVSCLQRTLIAQGYLVAGKDTGYFGALTETAVKRLQVAANIVSAGTPATTGYGAVGPRTRTFLQSGATSSAPSPIVYAPFSALPPPPSPPSRNSGGGGSNPPPSSPSPSPSSPQPTPSPSPNPTSSPQPSPSPSPTPTSPTPSPQPTPSPSPNPSPQPSPSPSPIGVSASADFKINGSNGPVSIRVGENATFSWNAQGVASCTLRYAGPTSNTASWTTSGSNTYGPYLDWHIGTYIWTYSCEKTGGGSVSDSLTFTVAPSVQPSPPPQPPPTPSPPPSNLLSCGITQARLDQIHRHFDGAYQGLVNSLNNPDNYPQVIYDTQILTASVLQAAEYCKDVYMLDKLAKLYSIAFQHVRQDPQGNYVWPEADGYEQVLASSQFMYAVTRLIRVIVDLDLPNATSAMNEFVRSTPSGPRGYAMAHYDRWINKKSMWIWPECGAQGSGAREYTFPEYVIKKRERTLGYRSGAPAYCNALNDVDLWVGAGAMELLVADIISHNRIGLPEQQRTQLTDFTREVIKLFESRVSVVRSTSPLCGGACEVAGLDMGGWTGHPEHLLPGTQTWDISHARRLVQFLDTMYSHADITLARHSKEYITNLFARSLAYLVFNGDYNDPAFANYLNGSSQPYRTYGPYVLSREFPSTGYAFWAPYESTFQKIVDALTVIIDARKRTSYVMPEGEIWGGDLGYMEFYASLTRPPR